MPESESQKLGVDLFVFAALLVLSVYGGYVVIRCRFSVLPESSVAILIGAAFGAVLRLTTDSSGDAFWTFNADAFYYALLPPIIFEAGYTLQRRLFFDNLGPILTFAVFGTVISSTALAALIIGAGALGWLKSSTLGGYGSATFVKEALVFSSLVSAVDPVATLAILGSPEVGADPMLQSVLFGESVLNDAVAIVLFDTFARAGPPRSASDGAMLIVDFLYVSGASLAIGISFALMLCMLLRHSLLHQQAVHLEIALVVGTAYAAYTVPQALDFSGILSLFFCGIVLGHYNWYNLSHAAKLVTGHLFKCISYLAETLVFGFLGISVFDPRVWRSADWVFIGVALGGCFISRALNTFPLSLAANASRKQQISFPTQFVIWFSGLRGAICFSLALKFPDADSDSRGTVVSTCIFIVLATTLGLGSLTSPLVKAVGLARGTSMSTLSRGASSYTSAVPPPQEQPLLNAADSARVGNLRAPPLDPSKQTADGWATRAFGWFVRVDKVHFQRWFGGPATAAAVRRKCGGELTAASSLHSFFGGSNIGGSNIGMGGGSGYGIVGAGGSNVGGSNVGGSNVGSRCSDAEEYNEAAEEAKEAALADEIFWLVRAASRDPVVSTVHRNGSTHQAGSLLRVGTDPATVDI